MAYTRVYTITTTRQVIMPVDGSAQEIHFHSASGTSYIGGEDVTTDNGYKVDNGEKFSMLLHPGDTLYAITSSGSVQVMLLVFVR